MGADAAGRAGPWERDVERWVDRVQERVGPDAIALCGSYARGTFVTEGSDVDVLVVGGRLPPRMYDRFCLMTELALDLPLPLEPIAYSRAEFERLIEAGHVGVYDALAFGVPLRGDQAWAQWLRRFSELQGMGLCRGRHSWRMPSA